PSANPPGPPPSRGPAVLAPGDAVRQIPPANGDAVRQVPPANGDAAPNPPEAELRRRWIEYQAQHAPDASPAPQGPIQPAIYQQPSSANAAQPATYQQPGPAPVQQPNQGSFSR
ncbi:MAG: hypothetical protein WAU84_19840, partial [Thermoguttaceae bacterium]